MGGSCASRDTHLQVLGEARRVEPVAQLSGLSPPGQRGEGAASAQVLTRVTLGEDEYFPSTFSALAFYTCYLFHSSTWPFAGHSLAYFTNEGIELSNGKVLT